MAEIPERYRKSYEDGPGWVQPVYEELGAAEARIRELEQERSKSEQVLQGTGMSQNSSQSITLEVLRCKDCKRLVFAANDLRLSHHKCSGQWTVVFTEKVVIPQLAQLQARNQELEKALRQLANEASGFKSMADPFTHGHTNMAVLGLRIDEARAALAHPGQEVKP